MRKLFLLVWPGTIFFPIFWFPILIPLLTGFITVLIDGLLIANSASGFDQDSMKSFSSTAFVTAQLSFLSTDVWALTTILMSSAKKKLNGAYVWGHSFAVIIAMFVHLLLIIMIKLLGFFPYFIHLSSALLFIGFVGVFWVRAVVYGHIEKSELKEVFEDNH